MKNSTRSLFGILLLVATTLSLMAPAAEAGGRGKHRRHARSQASCEPRGAWNADWRGGREARWSGRGEACAEHAAHRFFDGRAYCAGRTADGWWRSAQRCEDDYGRKLVNDPAWVASFQRGCEGGGQVGWRGDHRW